MSGLLDQEHLSHPVVTVPGEDGPIFKLANSHLRDSINAILKDVDPGHGSATITIGKDGEAGLAIATRLKDTGPVRWGVVVAASYDWATKKPSYQAALDASW